MKKSNGFTLIEIMVVVVIIGLLTTIVIASFGSNVETARVRTTHTLLTEVYSQIEIFKLDHSGRPPESLSELLEPPKEYLLRIPSDAWHRELAYRPDLVRGTYELLSLGADGKEGGDERAKDISYRDPPPK